MPTITADIVDELAAEYEREEPFDTVEREQLETLGDAFARGEFGWRDAEWVVRWYYRRPGLGVTDAERRAAEDRFGDNEYETVADALERSAAETDATSKVAALTALDGVDVPVASAFLAFRHPERFVVVDERTWAAAREFGCVSDPYPDPPSPRAYATYLDAVRAVADRTDRDLWTVYRALWRRAVG